MIKIIKDVRFIMVILGAIGIIVAKTMGFAELPEKVVELEKQDEELEEKVEENEKSLDKIGYYIEAQEKKEEQLMEFIKIMVEK